MSSRAVFFVSDSTGITAETLGNALLTQFDGIDYEKLTLPFVSDRGLAEAAAQKINDASLKSGRVIVFSTFSNPELHDVICRSNALVMDLFSAFLPGLKAEFQADSTHATGRYHNLGDQTHYDGRIDAIDFALNQDDGASTTHCERADIILVGVSRSGKTPTCIYRAMQFGLRAANYPLTADDLERTGLPEILEPYVDRLYGLTINPQRLRQIRQIRRPDSRYASLAQCRKEVGEVEALFRSRSIAYLDTSLASAEEIASRVIVDKGLQRRSF
jgi:regulator of PEP synthase PpsR (kinase-PPPase family)